MDGKDWVDLLKYPVTIVTSLVVIIIGCLVLGITPSNISVGDVKVGLSDLRKDMTLSNIELEKKIKREIRQELATAGADSTLPENNMNDTFLVDEEVSDEVAALATVQTANGEENIFKSAVGYIWIGNSNPVSNLYTRLKLEGISDFSQIQIGQEYIVNANMVIRQSDPVENVNYFEGVTQVGLVTRGSKVKILDIPAPKILRDDCRQHWAKIRVME